MYQIFILTKKLPLRDLRPYYQRQRFLELCRPCPNFGTVWSCPPYDFEPEALLATFAQVEIFGTQLIFDTAAQAAHNKPEAGLEWLKTVMSAEKRRVDRYVRQLEKTTSHSLALYGGGCRLCPACARTENRSCRRPAAMRYSLESLGYDVGAIAADLLHTPLQWFTNKLPAYMMLVTALLS